MANRKFHTSRVLTLLYIVFFIRDHAQIMTTEVATLGHGNPSYMVEVIRVHADGPIKREMTSWTTNEIAGLVVFWA